MRKHDELTDPRSCLNRARADEWVFTLLGRDAAAADTVEFWIQNRIARGKNTADDSQITEAREWVMVVRAEHLLAHCDKISEAITAPLAGKRMAEKAAVCPQCGSGDCSTYYDDTRSRFCTKCQLTFVWEKP